MERENGSGYERDKIGILLKIGIICIWKCSVGLGNREKVNLRKKCDYTIERAIVMVQYSSVPSLSCV